MSSAPSLLKNSAFLTGKVVISIFIAFFSTRLLIQALGDSDYGLYNVVAGFILLLTSIRSLFSSAIQRFINVANGRGDTKHMNTIFNVGVVIHMLVAIAVIVLAETIGLWYVNNKMVVDSGRLIAANYVYQFSILMALAFVLVIPFEALLIAHERLKFYAINTTIEIIVKLIIVISLSFANADKLIIYAFLLMLSTLVFRINIVFYVIKNLKQYKLTFNWDKKAFKELLNFSGWNFLGSITYITAHEGINLVLNIFGGTIINTPRGLSYQIMNALNQFVNNLVLAVSPRVTSNYESEKDRAIDLLTFTTRCVFYVVLAIVLSLFLNLNMYLEFWLSKVPEYTAIFTKLILIYLLVKIFFGAMNTLMMADGDLKKSHTMISVISLSVVPVCYMLLSNGYQYYTVFYVLIFSEIFKIIILFYIFKIQLNIPTLLFFKKQFLGPILLSVISISIFYLINTLESSNLFSAILCSGLLFCLVLMVSYFIGITKNERLILINIFNKKILKKTES